MPSAQPKRRDSSSEQSVALIPTERGPSARRGQAQRRAAHKLHFAIDAALLRELGERLVGRAHIALAELIKNAYDADATVVDVVVAGDVIVVRDNGHGMTYDEFAGLWMRIGSPHKEKQVSSRRLGRPLTGSKGVGRLAAQFLAHDMELRSVSEEQPAAEVTASVDWDQALRQGSLDRAEALVDQADSSTLFAGGSPTGTLVRMVRLKQQWGQTELEELARELWPLQPPFDRTSADELPEDDDESPEDHEGNDEQDNDSEGRPQHELEVSELLAELDETPLAAPDDPSAFEIRVRSNDTATVEAFERQMRRVLDLWSARITGRLKPARRGGVAAMLVVDVEFADGYVEPLEYLAKAMRDSEDPGHALPEPLHDLHFEIRVFELAHRQRYRIPVEEAREYLRKNGGVHVYDAGFNLPHYGIQTDWLYLERDHALRLSSSQLLPSELNVRRGLNALPTNRNVYGVVKVDTAVERRRTPGKRRQRDALTIQVSRDRLVENRALERLVEYVRVGLDYYATQAALRRASNLVRPKEPTPVKARRVREVLDAHRDDIAPEAFHEISREVDAVLESVQSTAEAQAAQAGLLGTLATAGIAALASEHEFNRQLERIDALGRRLRRVRDLDDLDLFADDLEQAVEDARQARELFTHLLEAPDDEPRRLLARPIVETTARQLRQFMRGVVFDASEVPDDLRLPAGSAAEWSSLLQNVYVNAVNAMLDQDERRLTVSAGIDRHSGFLHVQDTGGGIDLDLAPTMFEPFARAQSMSDDRRGLGFGGTGLGLTIVRMLADRTGCDVSFVEPDEGFSTCLQLTWEN